jgi:hypothetical protein
MHFVIKVVSLTKPYAICDKHQFLEISGPIKISILFKMSRTQRGGGLVPGLSRLLKALGLIKCEVVPMQGEKSKATSEGCAYETVEYDPGALYDMFLFLIPGMRTILADNKVQDIFASEYGYSGSLSPDQKKFIKGGTYKTTNGLSIEVKIENSAESPQGFVLVKVKNTDDNRPVLTLQFHKEESSTAIIRYKNYGQTEFQVLDHNTHPGTAPIIVAMNVLRDVLYDGAIRNNGGAPPRSPNNTTTKQTLYEQAKALGIKGRSNMTKDELLRAIRTVLRKQQRAKKI